MIFTMLQKAKNDRSVRRALPVYDNGLCLKSVHDQHSAIDYTVPVQVQKA